MTKRRHFQQAISLKDRLALFANTLREKASQLQPSAERDDLLKRARFADTAAHINDWANSKGLQPPK